MSKVNLAIIFLANLWLPGFDLSAAETRVARGPVFLDVGGLGLEKTNADLHVPPAAAVPPNNSTNASQYVADDKYKLRIGDKVSFQIIEDRDAPKTLLLTRSVPNDGKSMTSANVAITLASSGSRVLLVDADLRKGALDRKSVV